MAKKRERPFRAKQIFRWIHERGVQDASLMTDLPARLRTQLLEDGLCPVAETSLVRVAKDGTRKLAVRFMKDDSLVETVLIPNTDAEVDEDSCCTDAPEADSEPAGAGEGLTLCVSTQVGCAMRCLFCASGSSGLHRNLAPEEIVAQVFLARALLSATQRIRNIVFMGSGEPLHNYSALAHAIRLLTHPEGPKLSRRRITVSTIGLPDGILRLGSDFAGKVGLAVSLHAADDETRTKLVPINRQHPLATVLQAMRDYPLPLRRRITVEYALVKGHNDAESHALRLARLLRGMRVKINLIPLNAVGIADLCAPSAHEVEHFRKVLIESGYTCLVRKRRGDDISAACGQLVVRLRSDNH